eukprot:COSAG05_NODE_6089_length_1023_cov_3.033550_1_plen_131_part_00
MGCGYHSSTHRARALSIPCSKGPGRRLILSQPPSRSQKNAAPPRAARASATYRCDSVVVKLNAAAAKIMAARNIPTLDLHKTVTDICAPQPPHIYTNCSICRMEPCSYNYNPGGYAHISKPIATAVRKLL